MEKLPDCVLIISAFVKISKMLHETMNLTLEHQWRSNRGEWVCDVDDPHTLPPFTSEGVVDHPKIAPIAFTHGYEVYDEVGYVEAILENGNLGFLGGEGPISGDTAEFSVTQGSAEKKPAHNEDECDEIAALLKEALTSVDELEGDAGMPPYLAGWKNVGVSVRFLLGGGQTIQLYPFDIQAFEKERLKGNLKDTDTYVGGLLAEFENLEEWSAYKSARVRREP